MGALHVDRSVPERRADPLPIGIGDHPGLVERLRGQQLDPQPELELALFPEQLTQLGECIAVDHGTPPFTRAGRWPAPLPRPDGRETARLEPPGRDR